MSEPSAPKAPPYRPGAAPAHVSLLTPLRDAKAWLKARLNEGARCPLCNQHAKAYRRKITSPMARALIAAWNEAGIEWFHMPSVVGAKRADEAKLVHWGLLEEEKVLRPDGGRAGFWRVTDAGVDFIHGRIKVPKYAVIYNGTCLGHEGDDISIQDALGEEFRLDELMAT